MLEFATSVPSAAADNFGRRAAARLRLSIPACVMTIHSIYDCVLLDLSRTGARFGLAAPLPIGTNAFLRAGPVEVFGETLRCDIGFGGGVNGFRFDDPLSHEDVLAVRQHAETFRMIERASLLDQVRRWVAGEK
jgi:hypothetical protein